MAEFSFERATIAGVKNKNGYKYTEEDFNKVYKEWKDTYEPMGMNYIYAHYQRPEINDIIVSKPEYVMGKIIEITDTHVNIQVIDNMIDVLDMYKDPVVSFGFMGEFLSNSDIRLTKLAFIEFNEKEICYTR